MRMLRISSAVIPFVAFTAAAVLRPPAVLERVRGERSTGVFERLFTAWSDLTDFVVLADLFEAEADLVEAVGLRDFLEEAGLMRM